MEKINIEEVYGEPIDEDDTIFKLSNSRHFAKMNYVNDEIFDFYCKCAVLNNEYVDSYEITTIIANDYHEGKLNETWIKNKMLEMSELTDYQ